MRFKEEMTHLTASNLKKDYFIEEHDLTKKDKEYDEEELKELLDEFETFDFRTISFSEGSTGDLSLMTRG